MCCLSCFFSFLHHTASTEIYTLSLHDALPICFVAGGTTLIDLMKLDVERPSLVVDINALGATDASLLDVTALPEIGRATSELQSHVNLVCRLLLEKKKKLIGNARCNG